MAAKEKPTLFGLRLPIELKDWVKERAAGQERSVNWTLVQMVKEAKRLEESKQASA